MLSSLLHRDVGRPRVGQGRALNPAAFFSCSFPVAGLWFNPCTLPFLQIRRESIFQKITVAPWGHALLPLNTRLFPLAATAHGWVPIRMMPGMSWVPLGGVCPEGLMSRVCLCLAISSLCPSHCTFGVAWFYPRFSLSFVGVCKLTCVKTGGGM